MARSIEDIRETYTRLLEEEAKSRAKLERMRGELPGVREADEEAFAEAALADRAPGKRKEVGLRHGIENEEVQLAGLNLAHRRLLEEACAVVGEGRRPLGDREQMLLRRRVELDIFLTDDERQREHQGRLAPKGDRRPDDLIEFVEEAYGWLDRGHETTAKEMRMEDGYRIAVSHIEEAKVEHRRRGHAPATFRMQLYPDIVTEADYEFLDEDPGTEQYRVGREHPWPGSIQDTASNRGIAARKEA
jgi:hypothetical protein